MNELKNETRKKRIAIVYHYFQHYRKGVFEQLLESDEFEFEFYADKSNFYKSGVEPWKMPEGVRFTKARCFLIPGTKWMWQTNLIRLALRRDIDGIIFFGNAYYLATWISTILGRLLGKRIVFWTQGWVKPLVGIKAWFRRTFYHRANSLMVYGHFAKQFALQQGFSPETVHVVYNSLDYKAHKMLREKCGSMDLQPLKKKLFDQPNLPIVICCTRMIARRRLDWLIEAAAVLKNRGHRINLLLVGDGPELENLKRFAKEQQVDCHFYGPCYDEEMLCKLHLISAVTAAPGMVGLTAMHSLAFGIPLVTHGQWDAQMPEFEAIIPGRTGGIFENNNLYDLSQVLDKWTQSNSPEESVQKECIAIIERFYNPIKQSEIIERALKGLPANDLL